MGYQDLETTEDFSMNIRREIRTLALQALYQIDSRGEADWEAVAQSVAEAPKADQIGERSLGIARAVWQMRGEIDAAAGELAPDWPIQRRPIIDRNLIRLAYWEMASGTTPGKVAINEAVELAKQFGTERSPGFINALLDKMQKQIGEEEGAARDDLKASAVESVEEGGDDGGTGDAWLDDAMKGN